MYKDELYKILNKMPKKSKSPNMNVSEVGQQDSSFMNKSISNKSFYSNNEGENNSKFKLRLKTKIIKKKIQDSEGKNS